MKNAFLIIMLLVTSVSWGQLCIEGDCVDGTGTSVNSEGGKYTGSFKIGLPHGNGVFEYVNGDRYQGEFLDGLPHGHGSYFWLNGDEYNGKFFQGMQHGDGSIIYSTGQQYIGQFANNMPHGNGTCIVSLEKRIDTFKVGFADKSKPKEIKCKWVNGNLVE